LQDTLMLLAIRSYAIYSTSSIKKYRHRAADDDGIVVFVSALNLTFLGTTACEKPLLASRGFCF